jgi:hypothetical protein
VPKLDLTPQVEELRTLTRVIQLQLRNAAIKEEPAAASYYDAYWEAVITLIDDAPRVHP